MAIKAREKRNSSTIAKRGKGAMELKGFVITEGAFDDERIKMIEQLPSGDQTLVIYFRILALACKSNMNGFLVLSRHVPYNDEMLSAVTGKTLQVIRYALDTLVNFGMIRATEDGYKVEDFTEWLSPIHQERQEGKERVQAHREEQKMLPEKEKKAKRVYTDDDIEMQLSQHLYDKMLENNPEARKPNFQSWSNSIRLMIERDGRKPEQIKNMINWSQQDSFWKSNILSTKKLRDKYDQMKVRAEQEYIQSRNRRSSDDVFDRVLGNEGEGGYLE